jgi:Fe-S-cluster containining protein
MTLAAGDRELIQIVDAAFAEAARKSGPWLVCRSGCTQCCYGVFPITALDAWRLKQGLADLETTDPDRARRVRGRAIQAIAAADEDGPCPALDPAAGTCDLYAARPITCRAFGPPVRCGDEAVGVCELCYGGATDEDIAECEVDIDPDDLEEALLAKVEGEETTVAETLVAEKRGQTPFPPR